MEKLNIFIVEDESIVARDIQNSLTKLGYNVVGIANNGKQAIEKITELMPDLILMDIMIKGNINGVEVSEIVKEKLNIPVIFLTAYADHATLSRAKITEPYGYILKPFKEIDLHSNIEMAIYKHQKDSILLKERDFLFSLVENKDEKVNDIIFVKSNSRLIKLHLRDVFFVEAHKDYVIINTESSSYKIHSTMKEISKKLGNSDFARVHRSYITRLDKIQSIDNQTVVLDNGKKVIPVGSSYEKELMQKLNTL